MKRHSGFKDQFLKFTSAASSDDDSASSSVRSFSHPDHLA
jgi:hypothetical protein